MVIYWLKRSNQNIFIFWLKYHVKSFSYQSAWSFGSKDILTLSRSEIQSPIICKISNIWTCSNEKTSSKCLEKLQEVIFQIPSVLRYGQEYTLLLLKDTVKGQSLEISSRKVKTCSWESVIQSTLEDLYTIMLVTWLTSL